MWKFFRSHKSRVLISILVLYILFNERLTRSSETNSQRIDNEARQNVIFPDVKLHYSRMRIANMTIPIEITDKSKFESISKTFENESDNCTKLPYFTDLKFNNLHWQELEISGGETVYLYRAYYDNRTLLKDKPVIRIISVVPMNIITNIKFCQIWLPNKLIQTEVESVIFDNMPTGVDKRTCIITCKIPKLYLSVIPIGVSVIEHECDNTTNLLKVNYNFPENGIKEGVAVCAKAFDYSDEDVSLYFIQWLELLDILGYQKVFLYNYNSRPELEKVLQYYENLDRIELIPLTIPGTSPNLYGLMLRYILDDNDFKQIHDKVSWNDCYYMNMNRYKYIAIHDTDELIVPTDGKTIQETFALINSALLHISTKDLYNAPSGYSFNGTVYTDELLQQHGMNHKIPSYMSLLQKVYRRGINKYFKTILNTEKVLTISTHRPKHCIEKCTGVRVPYEIAYLHHYRKSEREAMHTDYVVNDTSIWIYKDEMITRVKKTLDALNLKPS